MANQISVLVVYALPQKQKVIELSVDEQLTVAEIIAQSGIEQHFPQEDFTKPKVGVFNRSVKLTDTCRDGDRIEIYRPLIADPKAARLKRAEKAKEEGRADKITGGRVNAKRKKEE
ncbi:RnfH family protein [Psychrobium sp. 1_MG-2023]|uniref:RnfH family protein n=1 Tax=Psychrobium sp. 1_MG-2023 TaxID=3062624 RepID=UPI000C340F4B|nr:RnfH family protein [Psychrobium sp. 1_MG-2023]MDP2561275.1 RnfH family protein [Psychrobium sp. 1_MG-2023]PKF55225.1 RnfH family protein [Alteromonadales bacterium alter-6D02]